MTKSRMGRVQLKIMHVLWEKQRATAREVTEQLCLEEPIAHTTVQTLLRKLEDKGSVGHEKQDRTFVYFPLVEEHSVAKNATRELIERVFAGKASGLAAFLLKEEKIPAKELSELRKLIDEQTNRKDKP